MSGLRNLLCDSCAGLGLLIYRCWNNYVFLALWRCTGVLADMRTIEEAIAIIDDAPRSHNCMSLSGAERVVKRLVKVDLNRFQFSALVSLVITIGGAEFKRSNLLMLVNKKQFLIAADDFLEYSASAKGRPSKILQKRRVKERRLFTTPVICGGKDDV